MVNVDRVWEEVCMHYFRMRWFWCGLVGGMGGFIVGSLLYTAEMAAKGITFKAGYYGFVRSTLILAVIGFTIFFLFEVITYRWEKPPFTVKEILNEAEEYVRESHQSIKWCTVLAPAFAFIAVSLFMYSWVTRDVWLFIMSVYAGFITAFFTVYGAYSRSVKKALSKLIQERLKTQERPRAET